MTSGREVATSSQDSRVEFDPEATPEDMANKINDALILVRDDIQRLASAFGNGAIIVLSSGNYRLPATASGQARVWAISDTATTGSTGANYHTLTLTRNGLAVGTMTYDTRRTEIPSYLDGCYLGETTVGERDVLAVAVAVTGAPAPALSTDNFCLFCVITES